MLLPLDVSIINLSLCTSVLGFGVRTDGSGILTQSRYVLLFTLSDFLAVLCCAVQGNGTVKGQESTSDDEGCYCGPGLISCSSALTLCSYFHFPQELRILVYQLTCNLFQVWARRLSALAALMIGKKLCFFHLVQALAQLRNNGRQEG